MNKIINILTIDLEDYFQVENFKSKISYSDWNKFEFRAEGNTDKLLGILDRFKVKATFFVLGWIAQKYPGLVKKIHNVGNEIASHGYSHELIYLQGKDRFRNDITSSKKVLEDLIGDAVIGYRAPCYSLTNKSLWAIDILIEEGFKYDSSIFPIYHDRGGLPGAARYPACIKRNDKNIWELPISVSSFFGQAIPFSGGGYFRLLPYFFIKNCVRKINQASHPVVIYIHPWEFDPGQPRIQVNLLADFRHYVNIEKNEKKLNKLLSDFNFTTARDFLINHLQ